MLPSWFADSPPLRDVPRRRRSQFIARTIQESARFAQEAVFSEHIARRLGCLQSLDARVKLLSLVALAVTAAFLHHLPCLWLIAAFAAIMAACSRIGLRDLFNRVWWSLPALFVIIAVPAIFSSISPGEPVLSLVRFDRPVRLGPVSLPVEISITRQGLASAALVVSRVLTGVLLAITLTITTRWQELLKAAYTEATAPFVLTLAITYRYVFVLLRATEDMLFARRARTMVASDPSAQRRWLGGRIGALFVRSRRLAERVYASMLARGYTGEPRALTAFRFGWAEALWVLACAVIAALAIVGDRLLLADLTW